LFSASILASSGHFLFLAVFAFACHVIVSNSSKHPNILRLCHPAVFVGLSGVVLFFATAADDFGGPLSLMDLIVRRPDDILLNAYLAFILNFTSRFLVNAYNHNYRYHHCI
jgi:hypothetical protein